MLILSRKKNEKICIGENIVIIVADIRGDQVQIGIEAPEDVPVDREEVRADKEAKKKASSASV